MEKHIENLNEWRQKIKKRVHDTSALRIIPVIFLIIINIKFCLILLLAFRHVFLAENMVELKC